jgi:hypothetical protein
MMRRQRRVMVNPKIFDGRHKEARLESGPSTGHRQL